MKIVDKIKEYTQGKEVVFMSDIDNILEAECMIIGGNTIGDYQTIGLASNIKEKLGVLETGYVGVELIENDDCWIVTKAWF